MFDDFGCYYSLNSAQAKAAIHDYLGGHIIMSVGGTTIYSDPLPDIPQETRFEGRENEGDLPRLLV